MYRLTEKEEEVMEMIWAIGPCAPKDVVARYDEPKPHVNTIATMFQSLERKGYLSHEAKGRGYIYYAVEDKEKYGRNKMKSFVGRFFGNSYMKVVSAFVEEEKVTEDELIGLLRQLKEKEQ